MKASKESSSRLCPLGDGSLSAARWGVSGVASRVSDTARVSGGSRGGAPPPACLRRRGVLGSPGGRHPPDLWLMLGGGRPHTRCSALVLQVLCQAGQRSTPRRLRESLCPVGRHSALPAGPLSRQGPPLVLALRGPPHFFRAHRGLPALRLGWQCRRLGFIVRRVHCPFGVAFRHGRRLGSASRARRLRGARRGGGACRVRAGAWAGGWATGR